MTWDAYNRRKEILHDVLAIAEQNRGQRVTEMLAQSGNTGLNEVDLLLDAQMAWFQLLSSHLERGAFLGDGDFQSAAIEAWHAAADDAPVLRHLLDDNVHMPELQGAFMKEHEFLARAAGVAPDHRSRGRLGQEIKEKAFLTKVYVASIPDTPAGIMARIREALVA